MERKLVLESCLNRGRWGLLEMYILLTDDIVEFDVIFLDPENDLDELITIREAMAPDIDIRLDYKLHPDLFLELLIARCPVSINRCGHLWHMVP